MKTLTLDIETFYDKDFSLKGMTTQEYIHDRRFEIIGLAVAVDSNPPESFSGDLQETQEWLSQFDWENSLVIAHNAIFDGAILEQILGIKPAKYFCTMMASRPFIVPHTGSMSLAAVSDYLRLGKKGTEVADARGLCREDFDADQIAGYMEYCSNDVDLCYRIYQKLIHRLPESECQLLDLTIKKFTRPQLILDEKLIEQELADYTAELEMVKIKASLVSGIKNFRQNEQLAEFLRSKDIEPGMKLSPRTGKRAYAFAKTDPFMMELAEHPDEIVRMIHRARTESMSSITGTRLKKFLALAKTGHKFSIPLLYYGAHTGRFSGLDTVNIQNLPRGSALRDAIRAPEGYSLVAGDLSQIEARIVAVLAGQSELVKGFANGEDVYCDFASHVYDREISKADEAERFVGKVGILSLGFGAGKDRFYETLKSYGVNADYAFCERVVTRYRSMYSSIKQLWRTLDNMLPTLASNDPARGPGNLLFGNKRILLPNDMDIVYTDLAYNPADSWTYTKRGRLTNTNIYGGALLENIAQALARIIISDAELRIAKHGIRAVFQVHDELVYVIKDEQIEKFKKALMMALTMPVPWMPELPVAAEIGVGKTYKECK